MEPKEIEKIFKQIGMIKEGHFLLASGLHSGLYFEKFRLLEYPEYVSVICQQIADAFKKVDTDIVAGPTTGGVIIAFEVAHFLNKRCIFAERSEKGRDFLRGYHIKEGEKILLVDDVFTTGGSIRDTIDAISRNKGVLTGVGVVIDRSEKPILDFGVPFFAVYKSPTKNYIPEECPLCRQGIELIKPGGKGIK